MLDLLRRSLPAGIKLRMKRILGVPITKLHDDWKILTSIGPVEGPHYIVDVGAHAGWFFHCWLDWCPNGRVHAFEPYPQVFERTLKGYGSDSRVKMVNAAVGAECCVSELKVLAESEVSNSLLEPSQRTWEEICYRTGSITKVHVPVITLDSYCCNEGIDDVHLLKIDVQGFELNVLKGSQSTLSRVRHILVESAIRPLYEGAPRFSQVYEYLSSRGFNLIGMQAWHRGNNVLMEADMLFQRSDLHGPVDQSVVRVIERLA